MPRYEYSSCNHVLKLEVQIAIRWYDKTTAKGARVRGRIGRLGEAHVAGSGDGKHRLGGNDRVLLASPERVSAHGRIARCRTFPLGEQGNAVPTQTLNVGKNGQVNEYDIMRVLIRILKFD